VTKHANDRSEYIGTVVFKLFDAVVPLTARNFRGLAIGHQGYGYEGSIFSRVVPEFLIQGGDCIEGGRGGRSIFGGEFKGVLVLFILILFKKTSH
jgi:cyclophilin family peptidyl-prolyl cis-trans isomerase